MCQVAQRWNAREIIGYMVDPRRFGRALSNWDFVK
jgi:hypothetical protein